MANNKNYFIFLTKKEGYLSETPFEYYNKEKNQLDLLNVCITDRMFDAMRFSPKQAKGLRSKLEKHGYNVALINPFVESTVYKLRFPYESYLQFDFFNQNVNIFTFKNIELDPTDHESDKSEFYFTTKYKLKEFVVSRMMYLKSQFHDIVNHNYNCFLEKIEKDTEFSTILRDKSIDGLLQDS